MYTATKVSAFLSELYRRFSSVMYVLQESHEVWMMYVSTDDCIIYVCVTKNPMKCEWCVFLQMIVSFMYVLQRIPWNVNDVCFHRWLYHVCMCYKESCEVWMMCVSTGDCRIETIHTFTPNIVPRVQLYQYGGTRYQPHICWIME